MEQQIEKPNLLKAHEDGEAFDYTDYICESINWDKHEEDIINGNI